MKRIGISAAFVFLVACGADSGDSSFGASSSGGAFEAAGPAASGSRGGSSSGTAAPAKSVSSAGASDGTTSGSAGSQVQGGLLTAGVWDDNLNFAFFEHFLGLGASIEGVPAFTFPEREAASKKWSQRTGASELDVAFLIDTTGSMGDELRYLQTEIDGIAQNIKAKFPQTSPRYGLVVYKDLGDLYVTRRFEFDEISGFRANLAAQSVGGGGDYPEAASEGLEQMLGLSWRTGAVARVAFWVADAPHHAVDTPAVKNSIEAAVAKDVHVYPVAASGADERAELTMRTAAQMTGGRYLFLTDDSGIGDAHAEPHIPCYNVTRFDSAVVRMVEGEMKGMHIAPEPAEILRTVGNPIDGVCTTSTVGAVAIY